MSVLRTRAASQATVGRSWRRLASSVSHVMRDDVICIVFILYLYCTSHITHCSRPCVWHFMQWPFGWCNIACHSYLSQNIDVYLNFSGRITITWSTIWKCCKQLYVAMCITECMCVCACMCACVCVCVVVVELCVCVWLCGCGGRLVLWVSMNGMTLQHTLLHQQTHQACITLMQEQDK